MYKDTVCNAYIPNAPNTLSGSVLPGTPNIPKPTPWSYLQKGFVCILADKLPFLREYPYVSNHIYTWIHWIMSVSKTPCFPPSTFLMYLLVWGRSVKMWTFLSDNWRAEQLSNFLMRDLLTCILDDHFQIVWKKTPTKMVITNYMAKHRMQSNKKCNTNPFHQIPSDCCAFLFNITLFFGVNLRWSCFLSDFHFAAFHRECLSLKKKILLSGRASTGKSSNPLVTINAVQYHPPISFSMEPENDGVSPKGISSTRRSCCGSVPHPLFSPMVQCF